MGTSRKGLRVSLETGVLYNNDVRRGMFGAGVTRRGIPQPRASMSRQRARQRPWGSASICTRCPRSLAV